MARSSNFVRFALCLLPLLAAGCADMPAVKVVRDDVAGVSRKTDTINVKVDTMERQLAKVADQMGTVRNTQGREIDQMRADIMNAVQQVAEQNQKLQGQIEALQQRFDDVTDQLQIARATKDTAKKANVTGTEKLFRTAEADFQRGRYDLAYTGFQNVIDHDSTKVYAPKALYQMAETRYAQRNWEEARTLYKKFARTYPRNSLVCPAWFKIGLSWQQEGKLADRDSAWSTLQTQCPGSNEAQRAADLKTSDQ